MPDTPAVDLGGTDMRAAVGDDAGLAGAAGWAQVTGRASASSPADRGAEVHEGLREWDYGAYEGRTTPQIRNRVDALIAELIGPCRTGGHAPVFGHGHRLRALAARWVGQPIAFGRHLGPGTASVSTLGWKRELAVIEVCNDRAHPGEV